MEKESENRLRPQKKIPYPLVYMKALNPKKLITPTNTTITHNNKTAHTDTQKANTLSKYFKSTKKHSCNPTYRKINKLTKSLTSTPIIMVETERNHAIKQSKNNNFTGPDNINTKHLGPTTIKNLTNLINTTVNKNTIPQIWKISKIIPIAKPNKDPLHLSSYRPIALLSPIAKTLKKLILPHITTNIILLTHQHGFRAAHSTTPALHQINNTILTGFNEKKTFS